MVHVVEQANKCLRAVPTRDIVGCKEGMLSQYQGNLRRETSKLNSLVLRTHIN